jgi:hypothetical protein
MSHVRATTNQPLRLTNVMKTNERHDRESTRGVNKGQHSGDRPNGVQNSVTRNVQDPGVSHCLNERDWDICVRLGRSTDESCVTRTSS